jgi:uncharacterized membrane protein YfcA
MDWGLVAFVVAVVLVASTAQTLVGFGFALISVPIFVTVLDVKDTVALVTLLGVLNSAIVARHAWHHVPWRTVSWMFVGSLVGLPLGLAVLLLAPQEALRFGVGVTTIVMAAALTSGLRLGDSSVGRELGVGVVSGVLNTSTSMNGPPIVLYLQGLGYPTQTFRGGLGAFFTSVGVVTIATFVATGVITWTSVALAASAVPAVFVGSTAGHAILRRVEAAPFRRLVFAMLIAAALSAVGSSLARMVG